MFNRKQIVQTIEAKNLKTINETIGEDVMEKVLDCVDEKDATVVCLLANDNPFLLAGFEQGLSSHFDFIVTA